MFVTVPLHTAEVVGVLFATSKDQNALVHREMVLFVFHVHIRQDAGL